MRTKKYNKSKMLNVLLVPVAAITFAVGGMVYAPQAGAADATISIDTTAPYDLTGTDTLTVTSNGSIIVASDTAVTVDGSSTGVAIDNSGQISADNYAIYLNEYATGTTITNKAGGVIFGNASYSAICYDGDLDGTLDNAGTISSGGNDTDWALAVYVSGDLSGTLTNRTTGVISATAIDDDDVDATALYVAGDITGTITNDGTISALANNSDDYSYDATAYGIHVSGGLDSAASLTNNGTISSTALNADVTDTYAQAEAYGVYFGEDVDGTLTNVGTISALAQAKDVEDGYTATATAYAVDINGDLNGTLNNSGTIEANASATVLGTDYYAYAYAGGVNMDGLAGTLTNSGTISAEALANNETYTADASAWGVRVDGDLSGTLTNTSTGVISATALANNYTNEYAIAEAYGLDLGAVTSDGALRNEGTIEASAEANNITYSATASAWGIYLDDLSGTLTNTSTGTISASAVATVNNDSDANATAYGIEMGDLYGTLLNQGTIEAYAEANNETEEATAHAYGLYLDGIGEDGTLTNSGTISAEALAQGGVLVEATATAYAIEMGTLSGELTNTSTGVISAVANATAQADDAYAEAYGIYMYGGIDGTGLLENKGTIEAAAEAHSTGASASATAYGICGEDVAEGGSLVNSGTISASAIATDSASDESAEAYAYGIYGEDVIGALTNSGNITAFADARCTAEMGYDATASAVGIELDEVEGVLTNSGTISAEAYGSALRDDVEVEAYGITMYSLGGLTSSSSSSAPAAATELTNTLNNSGTITAVATAEGLDADNTSNIQATAAGITMYDLHGELNNSGTISATATANSLGEYATAHAAGVFVGGDDTFDGVLNNSGTISASASAAATSSAEAVAYGVFADNFTGELNNTGTISGTSTEDGMGYSIYMDGGDGVINNDEGGLLSGNLYAVGMGEDSVTVNNAGTIFLPTGADAVVSGDYTQTETGVLSFGATSDTAYATLTVAGEDSTATFEDGTTLDVVVSGDNTLSSGDVLADVVQATTLVTPDELVVTDNSALFLFDATVDSGSISLTVDRQSLLGIVRAYQQGGSAGAAALLDEMFDDGAPEGMLDVLQALTVLETEQQVADAVNQLVPFINGDAPLSIIGAMHSTQRVVAAHQKGVIGLNSGDTVAAERNVWGKVYGSNADQDDDSGANGYEADTAGIIFGADTAIGSAAVIGGALSYSSTDIDGSGSQTADVDSYQATLYGSVELNDTTDLNWQAAYGVHDTDTKRRMPLMGVTAKGSFDSWSTHLGVNVAKEFKLSETTTLTPSVRADYAYVDSDSYTEKGAGVLNLHVKDNDVDELIFGLDGAVEHSFTDKVALAVNLGVGYDALADQGSITAAWAGAPNAAFKTEGVDPSEFVYVAGAGLTYGADDKLQVSLRYDLEGREDFTNQSLALKVNMPF